MPSFVTATLLRLRSRVSHRKSRRSRQLQVAVQSTHASDSDLHVPSPSVMRFADSNDFNTLADDTPVLPQVETGGGLASAVFTPTSLSAATDDTLFSHASVEEIARRTLSFHDQLSALKSLLSDFRLSDVEPGSGTTAGGLSEAEKYQLQDDLVQLVDHMDSITTKLRRALDDGSGRHSRSNSNIDKSPQVTDTGAFPSPLARLQQDVIDSDSPQLPQLESTAFDVSFGLSGLGLEDGGESDASEAQLRQEVD